MSQCVKLEQLSYSQEGKLSRKLEARRVMSEQLGYGQEGQLNRKLEAMGVSVSS